jgi:serine/threonine-protein kinase
MSLHYAAPEQTNNDKYAISFKTDFFALGIIGYQLSAGINPFVPTPSTAPIDILMNIQNYTPPTLNSLGLASPEFSNIIDQLLEKQPYRRYRTPLQLLDALKPIARSV